MPADRGPLLWSARMATCARLHVTTCLSMLPEQDQSRATDAMARLTPARFAHVTSQAQCKPLLAACLIVGGVSRRLAQAICPLPRVHLRGTHGDCSVP